MNPLISIWTQPKETIRYVLEYKTWSYSFFILLLSAISVGLTSFADTDFIPDLPLIILVMLAIISTFIGSIISLFISAALYNWIGKWLGGTGNFSDMFQMTPIASIPLIWMLPINLLLVVVFGKSIFIGMDESVAFMSLPATLLLLSNILTFGLSIFGFIILSKGIGIVHHFSSWRGFSVLMIIFGFALVIFVPLLILLFFIVIAAV